MKTVEPSSSKFLLNISNFILSDDYIVRISCATKISLRYSNGTVSFAIVQTHMYQNYGTLLFVCRTSVKGTVILEKQH